MQQDAAAEFVKFWGKLNTKIPPQIPYMVLARGYSQKLRKYHNWQHILECLEEFEPIKMRSHLAVAVEAAIWLHDVVYLPTDTDNEKASAEKSRELFRGANLDQGFYDRVYYLITTTDHRTPPTAWDAQILCDIDLSILGKPECTYDFYAAAIRDEYAFVNDNDYREGRCAALCRFAQRTYIYQTAYFRDKYEAQARRNITRELVRIGGSVAASKKEQRAWTEEDKQNYLKRLGSEACVGGEAPVPGEEQAYCEWR